MLSGGPYSEEGGGGATSSNSGGTTTSSSTTATTTTTTTTTSTGGTSTGGTGGTTTTTTTTGTFECMMDGDCDGTNPCTHATCNASHECVYEQVNEGMTPAGTDDPPGDCIRPVCQNGVLVGIVDKDQTPDTDPNDCTNTYCLNEGGTQTDNVNEGKLCGQQPVDQCKESVCKTGACVVQNLPEGTIIDPGDTNIPSGGTDCRDKVCEGGVLVSKQNYKNCQDGNPDNCIVPTCNMSGQCLTGPGAMNAPAGTPCKKQNQQSGTCDNSGNCI